MAVWRARPGDTVGAALRRVSPAGLTTVMVSSEGSCAAPHEEQNRLVEASGTEQAEHCGIVGSKGATAYQRPG